MQRASYVVYCAIALHASCGRKMYLVRRSHEGCQALFQGALAMRRGRTLRTVDSVQRHDFFSCACIHVILG